MEPLFYTPKKKDEGVQGLGLFAEIAPDIRTPAPSAPGSETSEAAADLMTTSPLRARSHRLIMLCLASLDRYECFSMEEISERTDLRVATICARLDELCPMFVEKVAKARQSSALKTLRVNGYRLSENGRRRLRGLT